MISATALKSEASLEGRCAHPPEASPRVCCVMSGAWVIHVSGLWGCGSPTQGSGSSLAGVVFITLGMGVRQEVCGTCSESERDGSSSGGVASSVASGVLGDEVFFIIMLISWSLVTHIFVSPNSLHRFCKSALWKRFRLSLVGGCVSGSGRECESGCSCSL